MQIYRFNSIDSTNLEAWRKLKGGEVPPFIVVADVQTAGYGRSGHVWHSPEGGLWFSLAFRGNYRPELMSLAAAYAVAHTVKEVIDFCPRIRIPNDIVIGRKKLGGILIESDPPDHVLGVGLNLEVREFPDEIKNDAVSLHKVARKPIERDKFLNLIVKKFFQTLQKGEVYVSNWLCCLGQEVSFLCGEKQIQGRFMGIDDFKVIIDKEGEFVECPLALVSDFRRGIR